MGFLIAVEGIDGAGKTTIAYYIRDILQKLGFKAEVLKEPSDSEYGKILKRWDRLDPQKELELFILDRKEDVARNILPRLEKCVTVIMDRYYYSSVAYQGALGIDPEKILRINEEFAPKPDLTILLDISPEIAIERIKKTRTLTKFEDIEYLRKVREIYLSLNSDEIRRVDASKSIEEVKEDCHILLLELLSSSSFWEFKLRWKFSNTIADN